MGTCGKCEVVLSVRANLCTPCSDALHKPKGFCAEQLLSTSFNPTKAALLDCWGRAHFVEEMTPIGRRPVARGTAILEASVSRNHAEISRNESEEWFIRDVGSSNGTKVNGESIVGPTQLSSTCTLSFGGVDLYFLPDASGLIDNTMVASTVTIQPEDMVADPVLDEIAQPNDTTFAGFPKMVMQFFQPSAGGGGLIDIAGTRLQFTCAQYDLLRLLVERMQEEAGQPIEVRGFLPAALLISEISWGSPYPTDNHLKQLIRRVRKLLEAAGLGNLIESRRGFGYRLRCLPTNLRQTE